MRAKEIDFEYVQREAMDYIRYIDSDVFLVRDLTKLKVNESVMMHDLMFIVLCERGISELTVEGKEMQLRENGLFVYFGKYPITNIRYSFDFKCEILGFSYRKMKELFCRFDGKMMQNALGLMENPIIELSDAYCELFRSYFDVFEAKYRVVKRRHTDERTVTNLLGVMLLDLAAIFEREYAPGEKPLYTASSDVLRKFFILLAEDNFEHHTVNYFADKLCVTPKYLSTKCTLETGKTPSWWIKDMLVEKIKYLLIYTSLSTKDIVIQLKFPNVSFFGKFVKKHLGYSPMEYRRLNS